MKEITKVHFTNWKEFCQALLDLTMPSQVPEKAIQPIGTITADVIGPIIHLDIVMDLTKRDV